jgi:glycosyltransferase involved in cell wall biosynthesis
MKILHLNTFDIEGGAARAAYRLHQGLRGAGDDSRMLVQTKTSQDQAVHTRNSGFAQWLGTYRPFLEILPVIPYRGRPPTHWATEWVPTRINAEINALNLDIIHLHWVCRGFMSVPDVGRFNRPVIWTLHDSWAFTGGCHVPGNCTRYQEQCGQCPQLASNRDQDLSRWTWKRKARFWRSAPMTIVTPSQWLAGCARKSSLFCDKPVHVIPNGIDITAFRPIGKAEARQALGLPQDRKLALISAMNATLDINKGFHFLQQALHELARAGWQDKLELLVVGQTNPAPPVDAGVPIRFLGVLKDEESMRQAYAAADVTVLSSLQENLPNSVMESMACGTPAVSFNIGGLPQLIDHGLNGYLATPYDPADLAKGIAFILSHPSAPLDPTVSSVPSVLSTNARQKIETTFAAPIIVRQYQSLYQSLLTS